MIKVMLVDDQNLVRKGVRSLLELSEEIEVVAEAPDGDAALDIARTREFDLVLTDVNMPNVDGITLIRELRALPGYKFTPLLMLTTESAKDKKQLGKEAGATGWIVKPFNPDELQATVDRVLA